MGYNLIIFSQDTNPVLDCLIISVNCSCEELFFDLRGAMLDFRGATQKYVSNSLKNEDTTS